MPEQIINYGAPQVNFGEAVQAAKLGQMVEAKRAYGAFQAQMANVAQMMNSGKVTGLDGTVYDANTAQGQQAARALQIQAYHDLGENVGQTIGVGTGGLFGDIRNQTLQSGLDEQQRGAFDYSAHPAQGLGKIGIGAAITGNVQGAGEAAQQQTALQDTRAAMPGMMAGAPPNDPQATADAQSRASDWGAQQAALKYGQAPRVSAATAALSQATAAAMQHAAGSVLQALGSDNMMGAAAALSGVAAINPHLLPPGADPQHPFQFDPHSGMMLVRKPDGTPLLGADGQAVGYSPQALQQAMVFASKNPGAIPQIMQELFAQHAGARIKMWAAALGAQAKAVTSSQSSGMGYMLGQLIRQGTAATGTISKMLPAGMKAVGAAVKTYAPDAAAGAAVNTHAPAAPNGIMQAVTYKGKVYEMRMTAPTQGANGLTSQGGIQFFVPGSSTPVQVLGGTGAAGSTSSLSVTTAIGGIMDAMNAARLKLGRAQAREVGDIYGQALARRDPQLNPGLGAPTSSAPAAAATMQRTLQGSASAPQALYDITEKIESNDNPATAASSAGAVGSMQILPSTASGPVQKLIKAGQLPKGTTVQQALADPATNRAIGNALLTQYYAKYSTVAHTSAQALAATWVAYNAGPSVADAWVKGRAYKTAHGFSFKPSSPYDMSALPAQTRAYITKGLAMAGVTLAPAAPVTQAIPTAAAPTAATPSTAPMAAPDLSHLANPTADFFTTPGAK